LACRRLVALLNGAPMMRALLLWGATGTAMAASASLTGAGPTVTTTAVLSLLCLCCSAFFSASETALFSLQPLQLEEVSSAHGDAVSKLLARPRHTLASILIGNETVNIGLSTLTAGLLLQVVPEHPWLNIVIVTPVLLLMGEVVPKTLAFRLNRQLAPRVAPIVLAFSVLVTPIRFALSRIADVFLVLTGGTRAPRQAELREAHLKALIDRGHRAGSIRAVEQELLHNVFAFGEHTVSHLMTPRPDVFTINLQTPWSELLEQLLDAGHSRVPVWQGRPDNIVGILVIKKLLSLIAMEHATHLEGRRQKGSYQPSPRQLHKLLHPPRFVPTTKRADDLLAEFQDRRSHMAIVVNEHGTVVGVVTLDDLLNELVGEMNDETDQEDPAVTPIDSLRYRIRGNMPVDDFGERFHLPIPDGEFVTVGGLVLDLVGEVPNNGQEVDWNGVRFTVSEMAGQRITEIVLAVDHATAEDESTQESTVNGDSKEAK
jgi:putative hemolysin